MHSLKFTPPPYSLTLYSPIFLFSYIFTHSKPFILLIFLFIGDKVICKSGDCISGVDKKKLSIVFVCASPGCIFVDV